jgi:hypothetical protein
MERPDLYHEEEQDKKIPEEPEQEDGLIRKRPTRNPGRRNPERNPRSPDKNGRTRTMTTLDGLPCIPVVRWRLLSPTR